MCPVHTAQLGDQRSTLRNTPENPCSNESFSKAHSESLPASPPPPPCHPKYLWMKSFWVRQAKYICTFMNYPANLCPVHKQKQISSHSRNFSHVLRDEYPETQPDISESQIKLSLAQKKGLELASIGADFRAIPRNSFSLHSLSIQNMVSKDLTV